MIDPQSCATELAPLYAVVHAPSLMGLLVTCITIAAIALISQIERDPGPQRRR